MTKIMAVNSYEQLVQDLKREIAEGLARAQQAYDREKTITYWCQGPELFPSRGQVYSPLFSATHFKTRPAECLLIKTRIV